jgi:hypothetical protein
VWRGVYVAADVPDSVRLRAAALALTLPRHAVSCQATAAALLDLPGRPADDRVHVAVPPGVRTVRPRRGVVPHETAAAHDAVACDGLRVTYPARTWLDLAPLLDHERLVVLGDAAWRRDPGFADAIDERMAGGVGRRGVRRARAARVALRPGVDSPPETRTRLVLVAAGLPEPLVNADVLDHTGAWLARPDLSWPRWRVAVEYEGDHHRTDRAQWRRDLGRDAVLQANGWLVLRVGADDLVRPDRLVARVRAALASRA